MKKLVENIIALRKKYGYNQSVIAEAIGCDTSNWSKVEQGRQSVQIDDLEKIANCFNLRVIDLFTFPDKYVLEPDNVQEKVTVTFEISPEKHEQLMSLVIADRKLKIIK